MRPNRSLSDRLAQFLTSTTARDNASVFQMNACSGEESRLTIWMHAVAAALILSVTSITSSLAQHYRAPENGTGCYHRLPGAPA